VVSEWYQKPLIHSPEVFSIPKIALI
jgi:hypothetical protein